MCPESLTFDQALLLLSFLSAFVFFCVILLLVISRLTVRLWTALFNKTNDFVYVVLCRGEILHVFSDNGSAVSFCQSWLHHNYGSPVNPEIKRFSCRSISYDFTEGTSS
ncbi:MAG: hypothetical protein D3910_05025 [Candidatus Electrothrix sp. ATG2]|nr:hypothetical protein [Candidatus Electrothrix sp. ATG2]